MAAGSALPVEDAAAGGGTAAIACDPKRESATGVSRFARAVKPGDVEISLASLPEDSRGPVARHRADGHRPIVVPPDVRAVLRVRVRAGRQDSQRDQDTHRCRSLCSGPSHSVAQPLVAVQMFAAVCTLQLDGGYGAGRFL